MYYFRKRGWIIVSAFVVSMVFFGGTQAAHADVPSCIPNLQLKRIGAEAVTDPAGNIYVMGGSLNFASEPYTSMEKYDPDTNTWSFTAPMIQPRVGFGAVYHDGYIYAIGGNHPQGSPFYLTKAERYNIQTDTWEPIADLPSPRGSSPAAAVDNNGRIYLYGGGSGSGSSLPTTLRYDPQNPQNGWVYLANMHTQRREFDGTSNADGYIFSVGGRPSDVEITDSVERYDPAADTWTVVSPLSGPMVANSVTALGNDIYSIAGSQPNPGVNEYRRHVEKYDSMTDTWSPVLPVNLERVYPTAVTSRGYLYVISGYDVNGIGMDSMERYDPQNPGEGWLLSSEVCNEPPEVTACENMTIDSAEQPFTTVCGTITDAEGDALLFRWLEGTYVLQDWLPVGFSGEADLDMSGVPTLGTGPHELTLEGDDGTGIGSDRMLLTINNSQPDIAPTGGGIYHLGSDVVLMGEVSDFDGDMLQYKWYEGPATYCQGEVATFAEGTPVILDDCVIDGGLPLGGHTIILEATDGITDAVLADVSVNIIDEEAPALQPVVSPSMLWPPNHKMVDVIVEANAVDNSGAVTLAATVFSNEPPNEDSDGNTIPDFTDPVIDQETGVIALQLRAERSGTGNGRVYTITITATDGSGNVSVATVDVVAPHDRGKRRT